MLLRALSFLAVPKRTSKNIMARSTPGLSERIAIISIVGAACAGTRAFGFLPSTPNGVANHAPSWNIGGLLSTTSPARTTSSISPAESRGNAFEASMTTGPQKADNRPTGRFRGGRRSSSSGGDTSFPSNRVRPTGDSKGLRYDDGSNMGIGTTSQAPSTAMAGTAVGSAGSMSRSQQLRERIQHAPGVIQDRVADLRDDVQDRVYDVRERISTMTSSINSDYVLPLTHLAKNPSTIHYSAAMSARLSYCIAQQTVVSSTVGGKLTVDLVAVIRAVLAALADGREEPILEALRVPEGRITSTENYAWWSRNLKGIVSLMKKEATSIETGEYLLPYDMRLTEAMGLMRYNPAKMIVAFAGYYREELHRKKAAKVSMEATPPPTFLASGRYPDYFLVDDDFLSARSSRLMDYEMESKMWGMGDAMHRRSIVRIGRALADKDPETASLLDVGCGTGRFLTFVKSNFKMLKVTALDLSLFNLQVAKEQLGGLGDVTFVESNAEHMTIENESQDVVTCNFVLSSMPPEAQANVINEIARILKPGGKVIIVDATQPEFDGADVCTLDGLPSWGEMTPVYKAYLKSDVEYDLIKAGLFVQDKEINWVSKVLVASKPPRLAPQSTHGRRMMGVGS